MPGQWEWRWGPAGLGRGARVAACVVAAALAAGCATSVERRPGWGDGVAAGGQGAAWEVVFPAPDMSGEPEGDELLRRNLALNERVEAPLEAIDSWPQPARPTIERPWRLYFSTSGREYLFFRPERPWPWRPGWWRW